VRNKNSPAGQALHETWAGKSVKRPLEHVCRTPDSQYFPGTHIAVPDRVAEGAGCSGVEYQPAATRDGAPDPAGQNVVVLPHGTAELSKDPGGQ
jgi:hypothetical protein